MKDISTTTVEDLKNRASKNQMYVKIANTILTECGHVADTGQYYYTSGTLTEKEASAVSRLFVRKGFNAQVIRTGSDYSVHIDWSIDPNEKDV